MNELRPRCWRCGRGQGKPGLAPIRCGGGRQPPDQSAQAVRSPEASRRPWSRRLDRARLTLLLRNGFGHLWAAVSRRRRDDQVRSIGAARSTAGRATAFFARPRFVFVRDQTTADLGLRLLDSRTGQARDRPACRCTATHTRRGSADRTRTPTACCANTSRRAPTSPRTANTSSTGSPTSSTDAHARPSSGRHQPRRCSNYSPRFRASPAQARPNRTPRHHPQPVASPISGT
jgi:hypothetical protein